MIILTLRRRSTVYICWDFKLAVYETEHWNIGNLLHKKIVYANPVNGIVDKLTNNK